MYRTETITRNTGALLSALGWKRLLSVAAKTVLAFLIVGSVGFGIAVWTNVAPPFAWAVQLDAGHTLTIHNGPRPACSNLASTLMGVPYTSQHDCTWRGPEHRAFAIDDSTPYAARSLVWIRLPGR